MSGYFDDSDEEGYDESDFYDLGLDDLVEEIRDFLENNDYEAGLLAEQSFEEEERTYDLMELINEKTKTIDDAIGLDIGAGIGIGAFAMVLGGAKKVYAVDNDENNIEIIKALSKYFGISHKINAVEADAFDWEPPEKVDILYSETFHTTGYREPGALLVPRFAEWVKPNGVIIPDRMDSYVTLIDEQGEAISERILYDARDLKTGNLDTKRMNKGIVEVIDGEDGDGIYVTLRIPATYDGNVAGVRIETDLSSQKTLIKPTGCFMPPFEQEYSEPRHVREGDITQFDIKIIYNGSAIQVDL